MECAKLELRNPRFHLLGTAPSSPVTGQMYYNTGDNTLYWWDGTTWQSAKGGATATPPATTSTLGTIQLAGDLAGTATSPQIANGAVVIGDLNSGLTLDVIAAQRPALGDVSVNGWRVTNVFGPAQPNDAANKAYVDSVAQGIDGKPSVKAASTGNLTLSGTQTVDGVALVAGDRVLVKDQSTAANNGIYVVASGAWARAQDLDAWIEVPGAFTFVEQGTQNADTGWLSTGDQTGTLGTTPIPWVQFSAAGQVIAGAGLTKTGNTLDVGAGTGITVAADTVGLDTSFTDSRYWNITGESNITGTYTFTPTGGQGFVLPDTALPQNGKVLSDRFGWYATDNTTYLGGLSMDNTGGTKKMTLSYPTGTLDVTVPVVTFTGDARAVTPTAGDNDTSVATTAFVTGAIATAGAGQVPTTRTLTAGNGLTGGGDLTTNRTFDVGAGTGITVAADTVSVDTAVIATRSYVDTQDATKSGYYSSATHGAGTTISIPRATHLLRASRGLVVQVQEEATGNVVLPDVSVAASGDITVTFGVSVAANSYRVTVVG